MLKVLVIEDSSMSMKLISKLVKQAKLHPVSASSLVEAQHIFSTSAPEEFLCAVVDYHLPDAPNGQAIDFAIEAYIPTIVITGRMDANTRDSVLAREVVDYIPKENAQVYDYLSRLLARLEKNKSIGVLVSDPKRKSRTEMISLLRRHNFMTYQATTGEETKAALEEHPNIQLCLVDAEIEDIAAPQLVSDLRKHYSKDEMAIIGLAQKNTDLFSARFLKSGANDFLRKPYCYEEFLCRMTQNLEMIENVATIRRGANSDYLTGLPNRRYFFHSTNAYFESKSSAPSAMAIIDLDHFKKINDTFGHDGGDAVLKSVAKRLVLDFNDAHVARFGGEEFCVFFDNATAKEALLRAEKFRQHIANVPVRHNGNEINVTASIGITTTQTKTISSMLSKADALLYEAKQGGRNRIASDYSRDVAAK